MNAVDATEHYETNSEDLSPSLLTIVLDTNPHAWAILQDSLPLSKAIANILVFVNAHLAFNYANEVAIVASHSDKAAWLYPTNPNLNNINSNNNNDNNNSNNNDSNNYQPANENNGGGSGLTTMEDESEKVGNGVDAGSGSGSGSSGQIVNKYRPFRIVEEQVTHNLRQLLESTSIQHVKETTSTMMAGALTMSLSHINRRSIAWAEAHGGSSQLDAATGAPSSSSSGPGRGLRGARSDSDDNTNTAGDLKSRVLVVSVSSSTGSAHQYIPIMNTIFACQRLHIPIDVCKLSGDAVFLQQASDATRGVYMSLSEPRGLLQYLMMAFLPDQRSRKHLVLPSHVDVDFRAACFCHRRVVDIGFVCSICLSIFCELPRDAECLTCGTQLELGDYGAKPAVVARKKKKKKSRPNGSSATATPTPSTTPALGP